jgi:hypothetical protein
VRGECRFSVMTWAADPKCPLRISRPSVLRRPHTGPATLRRTYGCILSHVFAASEWVTQLIKAFPTHQMAGLNRPDGCG